MTRHEMPLLVVYEGELEGQRWIIDRDRVIIGRGSDCDIIVPERRVSRQHAQIEHPLEVGRPAVLHDIDVRNGTYSQTDAAALDLINEFRVFE